MRNKILIITAVWKRHDLTDIVLSYYGRISAASKGKISLLAVGSEGNLSKNICKRNGWAYIERPNYPVSHKWASLVEEAKNMNFDFLIIVGSDNLLSLSLIQYYDRIYCKDSDYMLGLKDLYFYMIVNHKSYHFKGYESMTSIGAGRCMSRRVLEKCNWKPWSTYSINRGLDSRCSSHINRCGIREIGVEMKSIMGIGIDIKHPEIHITDKLIVIRNSKESVNILQKNFPEQYARINSIFAK